MYLSLYLFDFLRCIDRGGFCRYFLMDSYNKINRGHNNQHSNHQLNYCDESSPRESFDGNYTKSSKSNSESPNSRRRIAQSTFECRVCLNTYQSNKELHAHLHTAQHLRPLSRLSLPEDEEKIPYRKRKFHGISCKVCFHEFDTQNELKRHLLEANHHWTTKRAKQMSNHDKSSCNNTITIFVILWLSN
jgi:hypothetical protein